MTTKKKAGEPKVKKMKPYTARWELSANRLARAYVKIVACGICGHPRHNDYICNICGEDDLS